MSLRASDLMGRRFHRLVVLSSCGRAATGRDSLWRVRCDCGVEKVLSRGKLVSGHTKSCGCLRKPHGMFGKPEYKAWVSMIQRGTNPKARGWERYGGRGIAVCDEWTKSFQAFLQHVGPRPTARHSLDRFPNPNLTVAEWSERTGLRDSTIRERLKRGWKAADAVGLPADRRRPHVKPRDAQKGREPA